MYFAFMKTGTDTVGSPHDAVSAMEAWLGILAESGGSGWSIYCRTDPFARWGQCSADEIDDALAAQAETIAGLRTRWAEAKKKADPKGRLRRVARESA